MAMSRELKSLYRQLDQARGSTWAFDRDLLTERFRDRSRRAQVASRAFAQLYKKAASAAGIDVKRLDRLHAKDLLTATRVRDRQLKATVSYVRSAADRRRRKIRRARLLKRHFERLEGNPRLTVCLWEADRFQAILYTNGNSFVDTIQRHREIGRNTMRTALSAGGGTGVKVQNGEVMLVARVDFVWMSSRNGFLKATGWLNLNGTSSLLTSGICFDQNVTGIQIQHQISVAQNNASGDLVTGSNSLTTLLDEELRSSCFAGQNVGPLPGGDDLTLTTDPPFPVVADKPVIVTVSVVLQCWGTTGARADIDLNSASEFGINIPSVWLMVD